MYSDQLQKTPGHGLLQVDRDGGYQALIARFAEAANSPWSHSFFLPGSGTPTRAFLAVFLDILFGGVFHAAVLFLVAGGLQLVFGVQRIINLACGAFYALGAYFGVSAVEVRDARTARRRMRCCRCCCARDCRWR